MRLNIYLACGHTVEGTKAQGREIAKLQGEGQTPVVQCPTCWTKQEVKAKKAQRPYTSSNRDRGRGRR